MKLCKLRIAFSVWCGLLLIGLIFLWGHSYFGNAFVTKRFATGILSLGTNHGEFGVWWSTPQLAGPDFSWGFRGWSSMRDVSPRLMPDDASEDDASIELLGFRYETWPSVSSVLYIPFWVPLLVVAAAGALPWVRWRIGWRAAISGACLIAAVLAIGLWIRSYNWFDITDRASAINICSMKGRLLFGETFMLTGGDSLNPAAPVPPSQLGICSLTPEMFQLLPMGDGVAAPYWVAVLAVGLVGAMPWMRFRFSLRTMLIGIAISAILLFGVLSALKR